MHLNNKEFDKFIGEICAQIKCKEVHSDIKEELDCHLKELKEEYIYDGATLEEANRLAIAQMGDSEKIGFDLDKVYRKKPEYKTLIITIIFVVFGLFVQFVIEQNTSSNMIKYSTTSSLVFTLLGITIGIAMYIFDYRKLEKYSMHLFIVTNLFVIFSSLFGKHLGAMIYIPYLNSIYSVSNAAFIVSILYIISLCGILPKMYSQTYGIIKIIAVYGLCTFMLLQIKGIAYIFIFLGTAMLLLIYIGFPKKYISGLLGVSIPSFLYILIHTEPYIFIRLTTFINFKESRLGSGFMNYRIHELLYSSSILGNGISKEIIKTTPALNQELIYCYIIYTFGWIISATIFILIIILLVNLFRTSKFIKNSFGKMVFLSISSFFTIEFLLSVLMNLNLAPIAGIAMPFFSYSGTSIVINITLIGLICSIYGRRNTSKSLIKTTL